MSVAIKNLLGERARLLTSLVGVAFAVMLVLVMVGIYVGTTNQVTTYIDHTRGGVWVMQPGTSQMFRSVSWIPENAQSQLEAVEGARRVAPILGVPSSFEHHGRQTAYYLLGYEAATGVGGPWKLAEGRKNTASGEVVLDRVLANKNGVSVGDSVKLVDRQFKVVGLSDETAAVGNFYAFISLPDASALLRARERLSYYLVQPTPGTTPSTLAQSINRQVPGVDALTAEEFATNSRAIVISIMGRPLKAMIAIALLVGIALVASTMLALAGEQMGEFGVLKAVGVRAGQLYRMVLVQAALLALGGYAVGAGVSYLVQSAIRERLGDVTVEIAPWMLLAMAAATLVMAVLGSIIPVRRVSRLDPATVFRR